MQLGTTGFYARSCSRVVSWRGALKPRGFGGRRDVPFLFLAIAQVLNVTRCLFWGRLLDL